MSCFFILLLSVGHSLIVDFLYRSAVISFFPFFLLSCCLSTWLKIIRRRHKFFSLPPGILAGNSGARFLLLIFRCCYLLRWEAVKTKWMRQAHTQRERGWKKNYRNCPASCWVNSFLLFIICFSSFTRRRELRAKQWRQRRRSFSYVLHTNKTFPRLPLLYNCKLRL